MHSPLCRYTCDVQTEETKVMPKPMTISFTLNSRLRVKPSRTLELAVNAQCKAKVERISW